MEEKFTMGETSKKKSIQALKPYTQNLTQQYHLRELARKLDINHQTLRPYLNKLKNRGIIIEKQKGRNKVFSLNHTSDLLPYYLVQAEADRTSEYLEDNNTIRAFWKNFRGKINDEILFKIETLVLFGSFAKGTEDEKSDIDLFLATPEEVSNKIKNTSEKLESITGRDIEIEQTSNLREIIAQQGSGAFGEIVSNHVVLIGIEKFIYTVRRFHGV